MMKKTMTLALALVLVSSVANAQYTGRRAKPVVVERDPHCLAIESGVMIPFTFSKASISSVGKKKHLTADFADFIPAQDSALPVNFKSTYAGKAHLLNMSMEKDSGKMTGKLELSYLITDFLKTKIQKPDVCIKGFSFEMNMDVHPDQDCKQCAANGSLQGEIGKSSLIVYLSDGQSFPFPFVNFEF